MTETLTDLLGRPAEIIAARIPDPTTHPCTKCLTLATTGGRFFVGTVDPDGRAFPFCGECVSRYAPDLGETVASLNVLARTLSKLELRHLQVSNNALHYVVREAYAETPPEKPTGEARDAVTRAVRAMISRQAHGITDISVIETVDTADVYAVIEVLATIIGGPVKELADGDVSGWLQQLFESADEDGDEPA